MTSFLSSVIAQALIVRELKNLNQAKQHALKIGNVSGMLSAAVLFLTLVFVYG